MSRQRRFQMLFAREKYIVEKIGEEWNGGSTGKVGAGRLSVIQAAALMCRCERGLGWLDRDPLH